MQKNLAEKIATAQQIFCLCPAHLFLFSAFCSHFLSQTPPVTRRMCIPDRCSFAADFSSPLLVWCLGAALLVHRKEKQQERKHTMSDRKDIQKAGGAIPPPARASIYATSTSAATSVAAALAASASASASASSATATATAPVKQQQHKAPAAAAASGVSRKSDKKRAVDPDGDASSGDESYDDADADGDDGNHSDSASHSSGDESDHSEASASQRQARGRGRGRGRGGGRGRGRGRGGGPARESVRVSVREQKARGKDGKESSVSATTSQSQLITLADHIKAIQEADPGWRLPRYTWEEFRQYYFSANVVERQTKVLSYMRKLFIGTKLANNKIDLGMSTNGYTITASNFLDMTTPGSEPNDDVKKLDETESFILRPRPGRPSKMREAQFAYQLAATLLTGKPLTITPDDAENEEDHGGQKKKQKQQKQRPSAVCTFRFDGLHKLTLEMKLKQPKKRKEPAPLDVLVTAAEQAPVIHTGRAAAAAAAATAAATSTNNLLSGRATLVAHRTLGVASVVAASTAPKNDKDEKQLEIEPPAVVAEPQKKRQKTSHATEAVIASAVHSIAEHEKMLAKFDEALQTGKAYRAQLDLLRLDNARLQSALSDLERKSKNVGTSILVHHLLDAVRSLKKGDADNNKKTGDCEVCSCNGLNDCDNPCPMFAHYCMFFKGVLARGQCGMCKKANRLVIKCGATACMKSVCGCCLHTSGFMIHHDWRQPGVELLVSFDAQGRSDSLYCDSCAGAFPHQNRRVSIPLTIEPEKLVTFIRTHSIVKTPLQSQQSQSKRLLEQVSVLEWMQSKKVDFLLNSRAVQVDLQALSSDLQTVLSDESCSVWHSYAHFSAFKMLNAHGLHLGDFAARVYMAEALLLRSDCLVGGGQKFVHHAFRSMYGEYQLYVGEEEERAQVVGKIAHEKAAAAAAAESLPAPAPVSASTSAAGPAPLAAPSGAVPIPMMVVVESGAIHTHTPTQSPMGPSPPRKVAATAAASAADVFEKDLHKEPRPAALAAVQEAKAAAAAASASDAAAETAAELSRASSADSAATTPSDAGSPGDEFLAP